jgi:hypothetical protein
MSFNTIIAAAFFLILSASGFAAARNAYKRVREAEKQDDGN